MSNRVTVGGVALNVQVDGPQDAPHITFSHSLATNLRMWDPQVAALAGRYRILRYDTRGHGGSDVPAAPYSLDELVGDAVGLLDELGVEKTTFIGLSMGGMIAQGLALEHPSRVHGIVIANSVAEWPDGAEGMWADRITLAREQGMSAHVQPTLGRWFTPATLEAGGPAVDEIRAQIEATPVEGYAGCCGALSRLDYAPRLAEIVVPVLLISGSEDPATTPEAMRAIHAALAESTYVELEAAHLSNIERSGEFTEALSSFLP
jgi:3-oxoadipate enol-lactonase